MHIRVHHGQYHVFTHAITFFLLHHMYSPLRVHACAIIIIIRKNIFVLTCTCSSLWQCTQRTFLSSHASWYPCTIVALWNHFHRCKKRSILSQCMQQAPTYVTGTGTNTEPMLSRIPAPNSRPCSSSKVQERLSKKSRSPDITLIISTPWSQGYPWKGYALGTHWVRVGPGTNACQRQVWVRQAVFGALLCLGGGRIEI
jgi:hypothetical protein